MFGPKSKYDLEMPQSQIVDQTTAPYKPDSKHSVTSLIAGPGVTSLIQAWSHTLMEIDHEIILRPFSSLPLIQKGLLPVTSERMYTKYWLFVP